VNGAEALLRTLVANGVDTCFTNPGTSEMHLVAALDAVPRLRPVLTLFEGVATGAADGFGRMAGSPAAAILHLGPGLGNGLANLHNARRARTPLVVIVGDHATFHTQYDAPLQSDIETVARNVSDWVRTTEDTSLLSADVAAPVAAALEPPGHVVTLIVPANVSWSASAKPAGAAPTALPSVPCPTVVADIAKVLRDGQRTALLLGGRALQEPMSGRLAHIAAAAGAGLFAETFPARMARGNGHPAVDRLAYLAEGVAYQLRDLKNLILVGAKSPVAFFAYPDKPSDLVPPGCEVHSLADASDDLAAIVQDLADAMGLSLVDTEGADREGRDKPPVNAHFGMPPDGELTAQSVCQVVGALLPEGAIVSDESITASVFLPAATAAAPPHDWLSLTGGAIGQGLPVATGAAIACPDRPVVALQADGSALYTIQALWTQAREGLDVTTVLFDNRSYAILTAELARIGATAGGARASSQLDLSDPDMDFVSIARGFGVPASRPATTGQFAAEFAAALAEPGPHLLDVVVPPLGRS
jgi:acetolactate synthase-1/2/3 large subunit